MSNELQAGSRSTPALDALLTKVQNKPEPKRGAGKVFFRLPPSIDVTAFKNALRDDVENIFAAREDVQINRLVEAAVNLVRGEKSSDVTLADVRAVQKELNTLFGRVDILCEAATSGIDELVEWEGVVTGDDLLNEIWAGLNLALPDLLDFPAGLKRALLGLPNFPNKDVPDSPNKMEIQVHVLAAANNGERLGPEPDLWAAREALRYKIQERLVSDTIMERFADRVQGEPLRVDPLILQRVFVALSAKTGITRTPEDAGNLEPAERQALDELLGDAGKEEPETIPGLIAATAGEPEIMPLSKLYRADLPHRVLLNELARHFRNDVTRQVYEAEVVLHEIVPDKSRDGAVSWNGLSVGHLPRMVEAIEGVLAPPPDGPPPPPGLLGAPPGL